MKIQTQRLGAVEATPESFVTLPEGLIGFEDQREFVLVRPETQTPFRWLLSFSNPELAFAVRRHGTNHLSADTGVPAGFGTYTTLARRWLPRLLRACPSAGLDGGRTVPTPIPDVNRFIRMKR